MGAVNPLFQRYLLQNCWIGLRGSTLYTFAWEVESRKNNRPLFQVSSDIIDMKPLTLNHLLLGRPQAIVPTGIFESDTEPYSSQNAQSLTQFLVKFHQRIHAISAHKIKVYETFRWTDTWRFSLDLRWLHSPCNMAGRKSQVSHQRHRQRGWLVWAHYFFWNIKRPVIKLSKLFVDNHD